jgi:hypothetical protein
MARMMTALLTIVTLAATLFGLIDHSTFSSFVMDTSRTASIIRASLAVAICLYCFTGLVRNRLTRVLMLGLGLALLAGGITSLTMSRLYGQIDYTAMMFDIFLALQWGILAVIIAIDRPLHAADKQGDWHDDSIPQHTQITHA